MHGEGGASYKAGSQKRTTVDDRGGVFLTLRSPAMATDRRGRVCFHGLIVIVADDEANCV